MTLLSFLLLGLCCGTIAYTVSKGSIFASLRMWILERSLWLGKLITCPYCTSHWVAFVAMLIYHPRMMDCGFALVDYLSTTFALVGVAGLSAGIIYKLFFVKED